MRLVEDYMANSMVEARQAAEQAASTSNTSSAYRLQRDLEAAEIPLDPPAPYLDDQIARTICRVYEIDNLPPTFPQT